MGFFSTNDEAWYGAEAERESNKNLDIIHVIFKAVVNDHESEPITYEIYGYIGNSTNEEAQALCDSLGEVEVFGEVYKGAIFKKARDINHVNFKYADKKNLV
jgi:hypothetical protein